MDTRIQYDEFVKWIAYFKKKDEQFQKWEWYAAQIPLVMAQLHGDPKKVSNLTIQDFTLDAKKPKKVKPQTLLQMIASAFGGTIVRDNGN